MLQITMKTRLLSSYLQMTPNFLPVFGNLKNVDTMQNCLDSVLQWAESLATTLSVAKCKILVLGTFKFSNVYMLGRTPLPNINHNRVLLWITNLHLNCI